MTVASSCSYGVCKHVVASLSPTCQLHLLFHLVTQCPSAVGVAFAAVYAADVSAAAGACLLDRMATGQQLAASGDLLRALITMADAHLVFARELFLESVAMPQTFQWAVAAVGLREKEPVNAGLSFLSHLLAAAAKVFAAAAEATAAGAAATPEQQATTAAATQLQSSIQAHGEQLVRTLVVGACDTTPRQLLRALAGVLYQMLQSNLTGEAGGRWLLAVLQAQDLPGGCCMRVHGLSSHVVLCVCWAL